jgi:tetratricopeptide (TPR) repeat protein
MNHLQQQREASLRIQARQLDQAARQAVLERDDWRKALDLFEQKLTICRVIGAGTEADRHELFYALHNVGEVCMRVGDLVRAHEVLEEGLKIGEAIGTVRYLSAARAVLGVLALHERHFADAASVLRDCLVKANDEGEERGIDYMLEMNAAAAANLGCAELALQLAAAAEKHREAIVNPNLLDSWLEPARHALGLDADRIWQQGRRMTQAEAFALATCHIRS